MRRVTAYLSLLLSGIVLTLLFVFALTHKTVASADECTQGVSVLYLRGSGQVRGDTESTALYERLKVSFPDGGVSFEDIDYKAEKVWEEGWLTGLVPTVINHSSLGKYQKSVNDGVQKLSERIINSSSECFVLIGYSQGAHVVGNYLASPQSTSYLKKILYVGLLGDPKYDTYGYIKPGVLPGSLLPWYRGDAVPLIQSGWLEARRPNYLPRVEDSTFTESGSWCYSDDMICSSNFFKGGEGHSKYPERAISHLVQEVANSINTRSGTEPYYPSCGSLKQDIVIALNTSPSVIMDQSFLTTKGVEDFVKGINESGCDVHVGLLTFGRKGYEPIQPRFDLMEDAPLRNAMLGLNGLEKGYKVERTDIPGAISAAMDFTWRDDAQKAVFVMSDGPGDNYTAGHWGLDDTTLIRQPEMQALLQKSREKGGVEIDAINITHYDRQQFINTTPGISFYKYMTKLVELTAGGYGERFNCGSVCDWYDTNHSYSNLFRTKPLVSVPNVRVKKGESVTLTAQDVSGGVIPMVNARSNGVGYKWFTDCGVLSDLKHNGKTVTFRAEKVGTCTGAVLARESANGSGCSVCAETFPNEARAVTPFTIEVLPTDYTPPPLPTLVQNIKKERLWSENSLRITWDPPANAAEVGELAYVVRDGDGTVLGVTTSPQVEVTDMPDDSEPVVLVSAASANGAGESLGISTAEDISSPKPEPPADPEPDQDSGDVLGDATNRSAPPPITQRTLANATLLPDTTTPKAVFRQITVPAQTPMYFKGSGIENAANVISQGAVHQISQVMNAPAWLKLTITAIPIAVAIGLGLTLKYSLKLRAKQY